MKSKSFTSESELEKMAKNGTLMPDYSGLGKDPGNLSVSLSHPLFKDLAASKLNKIDLKIFNLYLARINPKDPGKRIVEFTPGEVEKLAGIEKFGRNKLKERLRNIMAVSIDVSEDPDQIELRNLMKFCGAVKNAEGLWRVYMECSEEAAKYIFDVTKYGYIRYLLDAVISLNSRYSMFGYMYIQGNRTRREWTVSIADLKKVLGCPVPKKNEKTAYDEYYRFNAKILKPMHEEIERETELRYSYEVVKEGKVAVGVRFIVEIPKAIEEKQSNDQPEEGQMEGQKSLFDNENDVEVIENPLKVALEGRFDAEELESIQSALDLRMSSKNENEKVAFAKYCYAQMKRNAQKKPIKNEFAYLSKLITTAEIPTVTETKRPGTETKGEYRDNKYIPSNNYDYDAILEEHRRRLYEQYDDKKE